MPRRPRHLADGGYYHLLARGNNRLFLFTVPEGFETFQRLLARSKTKYPWRLSHYCLMANHLERYRVPRGHLAKSFSTTP